MFLDERGHRGVVVRMLGVLGALVSAGAVALIVIGALAFTHVSPSRPAGASAPVSISPVAGRGTPPRADAPRVRLQERTRRAARDERPELAAERREPKGTRARA